MPKSPDVIGSWSEIGCEPTTTAQIFIGCMDGFCASVELSNPALGAYIARLGLLPDCSGLAIEILPPQTKMRAQSGYRSGLGFLPCL